MDDDATTPAVDWSDGAAAEHIDGFRRLVWNADQLALITTRLALRPGLRLADVGSGYGFFGRCFLPAVLPGGRLDGFELDPRLVAEANRRAREDGLADVVRYVEADAMALPAADASYDVTMCHTLLMHLPDPGLALDEMVRITRPGGLVVAAEPDALAGVLLDRWAVLDEPDGDDTLEDATVALEVFTCVLRGQRSRGAGDARVGSRLPALMHRAGLEGVEVWMDDRVHVLQPPYDAGDQPEIYGWWRPHMARGDARAWWDHFRADYLAGGGDPDRYDAHVAKLEARWAAHLAAADRGALVNVAGGVLLMAAGRRPS